MDEKLIEKALKDSLFTLYYQPKIDLATKKIASIEALIRIEESGELILPNAFIPYAEKSGSIIDIDKWVFNRLIEDSRYISMMTQEDITISFNVSAIHFEQSDFLENLENIFNFTTDFISQFEIELTEYSFIKDIKDTISKMYALKEKGFSLSIDDFGTGYSSLLYLKDFPIDSIKIDKAFIDDIGYNEKTVKIIESIIYLAKKLDLKIVAEGVETIKQVTWLYENGCDEIQGYYYSKPLPMDKLIKFIRVINKPVAQNSYINWGKKYSVDNYAFDTHHMIIANILNSLYVELKNEKMEEKSDVNIYFSLLERYVDIHFKAEEEYMEEINYPDIKTHIELHRKFEEILDEFKRNLSASSKKNSYDLFKILKEWFVNHELNIDKKIVDFTIH